MSGSRSPSTLAKAEVRSTISIRQDALAASYLGWRLLWTFSALLLFHGLLRTWLDPPRALAGTLLLAWNPLILYETLGQGHNDVAMLFWVLACAWCLARRRYTLAVLALVAGALFKFVPLLLLPAAGLIALALVVTLWRRDMMESLDPR